MKLPEKRKFQSKNEELRKFSFADHNRLVYITAASFFIGSFFMTFYGFQSMIPLTAVLKILIVSIAAAYSVQYFFFKSIFPMKKMEYIMVSFFGAGPVFTALFIVLNFYIHTSVRTDQYKLEKVMYQGPNQYFLTKGIPCQDYPELCVVYKEDMELRKGNVIEITIAKGLGGFEVIKDIKKIR